MGSDRNVRDVIVAPSQTGAAPPQADATNSFNDVEANTIGVASEHTLSDKTMKSPDGHNCGYDVAFAGRRLLKILGFGFLAATFIVALIGSPADFIDSKNVRANVMSVLFLIALVLVVLEDHVGVNKAAIMLMVSATMWTFIAVGFHPLESEKGEVELQLELSHGLMDVGSIILFLLPAMAVVESIDHFGGFSVVTHVILKLTGGRKEPVMPILCLLTFFLSAIIDNLTATILSLKILRNVIGQDRHLRHSIGGLVVIAANAGGVWSPVGDVTTTMLWLQGKITVSTTVRWLFLPSFVAGVFPMAGIWWETRKHLSKMKASASLHAAHDPQNVEDASDSRAPVVTNANAFVLCLGISCIMMVPILKMMTGLPPYLGMLLALGIVWFVTDTAYFHHLANKPKGKQELDANGTPKTPAVLPPVNVVDALHKMDLTGLLFFAGVLLAVGALNTAGVLQSYAKLIVELCQHSTVAIATLLGLSSAIVDNVPLVQASINMFGDTTPVDDPLWQLVALAAGTGGSILSVGSIAGVTLMTMEGVGYLWYCRRVSVWAALGFTLGIASYELERLAFS
jgi:Na+/H+ antiporter NhaD/arsenite permease-like protein